MSLTSHLFTPNNKLTGQCERRQEEKQVNRGEQTTETNAAKIKRQIFEWRLFEQTRLMCNKQADTEVNTKNFSFVAVTNNESCTLKAASKCLCHVAANRTTHLLSVSKPTKSFFSNGTQSSGILSPDLSVARSSRLDSRTINMDSTKSSTLFSTSEQSSKLG